MPRIRDKKRVKLKEALADLLLLRKSDIARATGISPNTVTRAFSGENLSTEVLQKLFGMLVEDADPDDTEAVESRKLAISDLIDEYCEPVPEEDIMEKRQARKKTKEAGGELVPVPGTDVTSHLNKAADHFEEAMIRIMVETASGKFDLEKLRNDFPDADLMLKMIAAQGAGLLSREEIINALHHLVEEATAPPQACLIVHYHLIHLRDKRFNAPAYERHITHINRVEPVYDEAIVNVTRYFNRPQEKPVWMSLTGDSLSLYPHDQRVGPFADTVPKLDPNAPRPVDASHGKLDTRALTLVNRLQIRQDEPTLMWFIDEDCARIVMAVDFTSLNIELSELFTAPPQAKLPLNPPVFVTLEEKDRGIIVLDTARLKEPIPIFDTGYRQIEIRFFLNWDVIRKQHSEVKRGG